MGENSSKLKIDLEKLPVFAVKWEKYKIMHFFQSLKKNFVSRKYIEDCIICAGAKFVKAFQILNSQEQNNNVAVRKWVAQVVYKGKEKLEELYAKA